MPPRLRSYAPVLATGAGFSDRHWRVRRRLDRVSGLLDHAFRLPLLGWRFGLDPVLNLVPGLGTLASGGISAWLIVEAARLRVPRSLLVRMAGNVALDTVLGAIPLVGWAADFVFKANDRNMRLLRRHLDGAHPFRDPQGGPLIDGTAAAL
ncbi:DUF4112 domain-containing protein [Niveispirillum sp. BGYR6]|uniref:DUF4112 domain-containing protein n=1 Tax=Niveispirillum sp. BGYR6 TaxID=2971249 RepID=UPI0022B97426|nr:DUF4112 domain-containing protein [Niveispirillum sp. BGYR6]MDG5496420.1 DUF4112 domain-containing protein [Niveispirillum sp. BGYR6]